MVKGKKKDIIVRKAWRQKNEEEEEHGGEGEGYGRRRGAGKGSDGIRWATIMVLSVND